MNDSATPIPPDRATASCGEEEAEDLRWSEFQRVRASLAEVMDDDELRDLGFDLEVLDNRP